MGDLAEEVDQAAAIIRIRIVWASPVPWPVFAPRSADLDDQRFWRADVPDSDTPSDYGPLGAIARNKINRRLIHTQWSDMIRVAGSLVTNQVRAYDLLRMFARNRRPTPLGQAFAEYGRIDKTLHLLSIPDPIDDTYRRRLNKQLTVQESRHRLARKICHGAGGQIRKAYREGQEDQLAALGLVVNVVVLWNSRYLSAAVDQLRALGVPVKDEDAARLSPLGHAHLNCLGRPPPHRPRACGHSDRSPTATAGQTRTRVPRHGRRSVLAIRRCQARDRGKDDRMDAAPAGQRRTGRRRRRRSALRVWTLTIIETT